ncbi:MAG: ABC transporter permease [Planctomycetota bacterium]
MDALKITFKDLLLLSRDRRALVILVAMPMVIISIVGSAAARRGLLIEIVDFDQSETSRRLAGFLAGYESVAVRQAEVPDNPSEAQMDQLRSERPTGEVDARLVVQKGFEAQLALRSRTDLLAPKSDHSKDPFAEFQLSFLFKAATVDPRLEVLAKLLVKNSLQDAVLPIIAEKIPVFRGAAKQKVIPEPWEKVSESAEEGEPKNNVYQLFVPSYTVLFVFFLVNIMGRSFLDERDRGTLRRLRISPIAPSAILIGKTLPFLVLSLAQTMILMISGKLLFGMSWGSEPWLLIPIILSTSAAATALGLMFSTLARTEAQVSSMGNLILLSCAGISGCLVPRIWMSPLTQKISLFTPHAWALDAYGEVLTKTVPSHSVIFQSCAVLMMFTATFFMIGLVRFRRDS